MSNLFNLLIANAITNSPFQAIYGKLTILIIAFLMQYKQKKQNKIINEAQMIRKNECRK